MRYIPIGSKQIAFALYDDQSSQMHIKYHTGQTHVCSDIKPDQYQSLLQSTNPYDMIVKMASTPTVFPAKG
jgi:hypothetical protein